MVRHTPHEVQKRGDAYSRQPSIEGSRPEVALIGLVLLFPLLCSSFYL